MSEPLALYCRPRFVNPCVDDEWARAVASDPRDAPDDVGALSERAAQRVVAAYDAACCKSDGREWESPVWSFGRHNAADLIDALERRDARATRLELARFFRSKIAWGLASNDAVNGGREDRRARAVDATVAICRATGLLPVPSIEQLGKPLHEQRIELAELVAALDQLPDVLGFSPDAMGVAADRSWRIGPLRTNAEMLTHAYTAWRLKQMVQPPGLSRIVEIGGGFGGAALMAMRSSGARYRILDLPWVNAAQGYLLILAAGEDRVRLYGERASSSATIEVWPCSEAIDMLKDPPDLVVNCNSLPEIPERAAKTYLQLASHARAFLSINHECRTLIAVAPELRQLRVQDLCRAAGLVRLSRHPSWMDQGYVEEIYVPSLRVAAARGAS